MLYVTEVILLIAIWFYSGMIVKETTKEDKFIPFFITIFISFILLFISHVIEEARGVERPKFFIKEVVTKPDGSVGRADSIYYKIEGEIYNQENLK